MAQKGEEHLFYMYETWIWHPFMPWRSLFYQKRSKSLHTDMQLLHFPKNQGKFRSVYGEHSPWDKFLKSAEKICVSVLNYWEKNLSLQIVCSLICLKVSVLRKLTGDESGVNGKVFHSHWTASILFLFLKRTYSLSCKKWFQQVKPKYVACPFQWGTCSK